MKPSKNLALKVLLVLVTCLVYANALTGPFLFDSGPLTVGDARTHELSLDNARAILTQNYWGARFASGLYRPVTTFSYAVDYALWGELSPGYHATNLLFHSIAVLLGFGVALAVTGSAAPAFWIACLWAVHPINTEVVTNIAGRPDLIATISVFAGFLLYQKRWRWALFGVAILGCFAKESAAMLLGLVLLFDWHRRRRPDWRGLAAIAIPVGGILSSRFFLTPMVLPFVDNPLIALAFPQRQFAALGVLGKAAGLWFWPATLSADYSFSQIPVIKCPEFAVFLSIGLILLAVAVAWQRRSAGFWALLALSLAVPTSNLIFPIGSIFGERFLYLPGFALAGLVVVFLTRLSKTNPRTLFAALIILSALSGARTISRNADYSDELRFWRATAEASPDSFKPQAELAIQEFERGHLQEALSHSERAQAILADLPERYSEPLTYARAYQYYAASGDQEKARTAADKAARIMNTQRNR